MCRDSTRLQLVDLLSTAIQREGDEGIREQPQNVEVFDLFAELIEQLRKG